MNKIDWRHKTDDTPIGIDDLQGDQERFSAVLRANKDEKRSKGYTHVTSSDLVPLAEESGWVLFNAIGRRRNHRAGKPDLDPSTVTHQLAFRPADDWLSSHGLMDKMRLDGGIGRISKMIPRLLFTNNHAGTGKLKFDLASYEFFCSNTSITLAEQFGSWAFSHVGLKLDKLADFFRQVIEASPFLFSVRDTLAEIPLDRPQAIELANRCIDLRWDGEKYSVDPQTLISPRYSEQTGLNAYNVIQTIQGHITQGNSRDNAAIGSALSNVATTATTIGKPDAKPRKQRAIGNFTERLKINRGLWERSADYLNELGYALPNPPTIRANVT